MIQGFFLQLGAFPGDTVSLHVATDTPQFRVDIFRQGAAYEKLLSTGWNDGGNFRGADHVPWDDWTINGTGIDANGNPSGASAGWNGLNIAIPATWNSGVYIAVLVPGDGSGNPTPPLPDETTADARNGKALLVVKNPNAGVASQLLYKLPLFTYQSYNSVNKFLPGESSSIYQKVDVSLRRPGGGTGGTPWDYWNYDPFDSGSPRQTFQHWDAKLIAWLEGLGYRIDYCTDWDIHEPSAPAMLACYSVVLSVGHDEYYSADMRQHLQDFIAAGGNIAFLSGNTCWWRTEIDSVNTFVMHGQQTIHNWSDSTLNQPEDSLTGVSFRNAGEGNGKRPAIGYVVQHVDQWPFENTSLSEGDQIGQPNGLIGYECDGAPYDKSASRPFKPVILAANGTPSNLMILGTADVSGIDDGDLGGEVLGNGAATMAMYSRNGTIFTGATTDWPRVTALGDKRVGQITRNVLDRFGGGPKGLAALSEIQGIAACDAFYSADDHFRHAIIGTTNGNITEIFYNPTQGKGQTVLATHAGLIDLAAFYTDDDHFRHVIILDKTGVVTEEFYSPTQGKGSAQIAAISGAFRVAGFYSSDDGYRHAIVATRSGEILEVFYSPKTGKGQTSLGVFPGLVDIGAFYSPDDNYRHVLIAASDGVITELFYNPAHGKGQTVVGQVAGAAKISAYYAANDHFFSRRAQLLTNAGRVIEIRYSPKAAPIRALLLNSSAQIDVGAFYSPDDGVRHAILVAGGGAIQELFFNP